MKKIIAVDIDDVLSESAPVFIDYSNRRWGTKFTIDDYDEDWSKIWSVDHSVSQARVTEYLNSGVLSKCSHINDSIDVLNKLKNNYKLVIVTSRRKALINETKKWIKQKYGDIFEETDIHFAGIWDGKVDDETIKFTKADYLLKIGASYLIDDQIKHCVGAASQGVRSFLFGDYSWNQLDLLPKGVVRVNAWQDILIELDRIDSV